MKPDPTAKPKRQPVTRFNGYRAVAKLFDGQGNFLGSATKFRSLQHFITCAHVIGNREPADVIVHDGFQELTAGVIHRHPSADLAVVILAPALAMVTNDPFIKVALKPTVAQEVRIAGYARDMMAQGQAELRYTASEGAIAQISPVAEPLGHTYKYHGAILNDRVAPGMSGSAVFERWMAEELIGIGTGESGSSHDADGSKVGWMLLLAPYRDWLETHIHCAKNETDHDLSLIHI